MISNTNLRSGIGRLTLDQMLRQNAQRFGDTQALVDAPDRPLWADGPPRRMNWAQVDAAVSSVAGRFFEMGLPSEAVVCVQGLNISDTLIAILGCIRAGLVVAVVPVGFDAAETVATAERLGAKAIMSARKIGQEQPLRILRHLTNESVADIRFVGAFGADLPGGIVSFEDCIAFPKGGAVTRLSRRNNPLDNLAIITIDRTPDVSFAVARSHGQWIAAGSLFAEGLQLTRVSRLLAAMMPTRLAGLASGMVPWLMSGCLLVLHQAFDSMVMGVQMGMHGVTHAVLPEIGLQAALADNLLAFKKLAAVAAVTREPHRTAVLPDSGTRLPHFAAFGEVGVAPLVPQPGGQWKVPAYLASAGEDSPALIETAIDDQGYLALRGEQVSQAGHDVGEGQMPYPLMQDGWVMAWYPAMLAEDGVVVTGKRFGPSSFATAMFEGVAPTVIGGPDVDFGQDGTSRRVIAGAA